MKFLVRCFYFCALLSLFVTAPTETTVAAQSAQVPTLWLIGDSTVNTPTQGQQGWGQQLADFFDATKIKVQNLARGGRSSRTFQTEGIWHEVLSQIQPGDFVMLQFGHNDGGAINDTSRARASLKGTGEETQEIDNLLTKKHEIVHTFGWYLRKYIADTKAKGATPIVLSPVPRNLWQDGNVARARDDYGKWAQESAQRGRATFIDLNGIIALRYEEVGAQKVAADFFAASDHTHTTPAGARFNAESVVIGLRNTNSPLKKFLAEKIAFTGMAQAPSEPLSLWYRRPAEQWVEALPIGNGRIGGMLFGGIERERIQLNEDTLYAGGPYDPNNPAALAALPEVRKLIFAGQYKAAEKLVSEKMMAQPLRQMPYQTAGDVWFTFPTTAAVQAYRRDLNLDAAISTVSYTSETTTFTREAFASPTDQVIAIRLTASKPGQISFATGMQTPQKAAFTTEGNDTLVMRGVNEAKYGIAGALKYQIRVRILTEGGKLSAEKTRLNVTGANSATILIALATSYKNYQDVSGDPETITKQQIAQAAKKSYATLRKAHVAEHQRLFRRVSFDLGTTTATALPTDERIKNFAQTNDPQFAALYFQYGRYLLIASSRPGSQPANLQGIWNDSLTPPWDSKYTININTEMNYWHAETTNLAECVEPLFQMVQDLAQTGARTAKVQYGARGWMAHHNTDVWRATAAIDGAQYGMWPMGGAWLLQNLWEHYEFSGDKQFLQRLYPLLKGASQFFLDTLIEDPEKKWLLTSPSMSPENPHPYGSSLDAGPTIDNQLLRDLFANCIRAAEILKLDPEFRAQLQATRARIAPDKIGAAGQLQEWRADWDLQAPDLKHRHVSHLYGFYPSAQITLRGTPALAEAVKKTLEMRGDMTTGWAIAWRINLWARLQDAERTYKIIKLLISPERTYPNMFDAHPPFQIDGNFGGAAGMAEMLVQSHAGAIELLPALPKDWATGSIKGLRARGGFTLDLRWANSTLQEVTVHSLQGNPCTLMYGNARKELKTKPGATYRWNGK